MEEKVLIESYSPDTKKFLKIMAIIGLVLAMIVFMSRCSSASNRIQDYKETYQQHQKDGDCGWGYSSYEQCWRCEYVEENSPVGEAFGPAFIYFAGIMVLALLIKLLLSSFSLVVTDKRVYCKTLWIHRVCLPVDSITAIARIGFFNVLSIGAPAGRIIVSFVINSKAIYNVLNDLFIARQEKSLAAVIEAGKGQNAEPATYGASGQGTYTASVANGWTCTCGRKHAAYESSCVCGLTKEEAKKANSQSN